jgi:hypothetical protein
MIKPTAIVPMFLHSEDMFVVGPSGLDNVPIHGISWRAVAEREQKYRLEAIEIGRKARLKSELKEIGL